MQNLKPYIGEYLPFAVKITIAEYTPPRRLWHIPDVAPGNCPRCDTKIDREKVQAANRFWHLECFNCSLCRERMDVNSFIARDDLIFHPECYKLCYNERCSRCTQLTEPKDSCKAFGRIYHKNCLHCEKCLARQTLSSRISSFYSIPYCSGCYEELMKLFPVCIACKKPVLPTDKCKSYFWEGHKYFYHVPDCEKCPKCGKAPDNGGDPDKQIYCVEDERLYCYECYKEACKKICATCNRPIFEQASKMENVYWHSHHFQCTVCNTILKPNTCVFDYGILKCKSCATEDKPVCAGCGKPIVDEPVTACRTIWHPQCLRCQFCDKGVLGKKFTNVSGAPCCEKCYSEKMDDGTIDRKTGQLKTHHHHSRKHRH
ncbi:LIM domain containing protein [Trichomonas vaginalis G3]|uniref:LIM domain containing protein n=1 Tax=Trichomonas vaginalis (strain ATCC PRA-98 / G3) TaxID=412133 RepID=A2DNX9_TRIV3|nr:uncharacterized protein TVAGG3_0990080 [Trichomonas vaginalis G3]EAY17828.1 LIM domain containing protein [Trichomonas vaginalis G3]KAI5489971.1 zinc ion binding [Trichomonas vaginalis G3]|eukprot:XP_001329963.1 hypothetical protein [Trichomonas vaginalis G3]